MVYNKLIDLNLLNEFLNKIKNLFATKDVATQNTNGLLSAEDKIKIDNLEQVKTLTTVGPAPIVTFDAIMPNKKIKKVQVNIEPVQEGSGDPSPTNVRPITGWTGCNVTRTGKNLLSDLTFQRGTNYVYIGQSRSQANYDVFLKAGQYTIHTMASQAASLYYKGKNNSANTKIDDSALEHNATFDINQDGWYQFYLYNQNGIAVDQVSSFQLEVGNSFTGCEAYQVNAYPITFPASAGTVYGGSLDVTNGVLTVERAIVDLGTLTWEKTSGFYQTQKSRIGAKTDTTDPLLCSCYPYMTPGSDKFITQTSSNIRIVDSTYSDLETFVSAVTGQTMVYPLASPISYDITAEQVTTLLGTNNIWADCGDISVTYGAYLNEQDEKIETLSESMNSTDLSGSIVTFEASVADMPLKECEVDIEPVQSLNGYDHPWPGGGGKNLLHITASSLTVSGVTFTVKTDSGGNVVSIVANGTASANISNKDINFGNITLPAGQYSANGLASGSQSTYRLAFYGSAASTVNMSVYGGADKSFKLSDTMTLLAYPVILAGTTVNNAEYKPMIRLASETDATFEPYSNICPISGWTGCNVTRTGINIWDEEWELGNFNTTTGAKSSASDRIRSKNYIPCAPNTEYYVKNPISGSNIRVFYYGPNYEYLSYENTAASSIAHTLGTARYMMFIVPTAYGTTYNNDISINYPATDTAYHAYKGNTYPIALPSDAGTVYGGTLDVLEGKLTVTHQAVTFNGSESRWGGWTSGSTTNRAQWNTYNDVGVANAIFRSDKLISSTPDETHPAWSVYGSTAGARMFFAVPKSITSLDDWKAWLAENNVTVVYPLANPIEITLSPTEVTTLLGTNNIWADCGDVTVTYGAYLETVKKHAEYIGNNILNAIAPLETSYKATRDYTIGSYLFVGTKFYKVIATIAKDSIITPDTNVISTIVSEHIYSSDELSSFSDRLTALEGLRQKYYAKVSLSYSGATARTRIMLPYDIVSGIYRIDTACTVSSGSAVPISVSDNSVAYSIAANGYAYLKMPIGDPSSSAGKQIIFVVYPGSANSGTIDITIERSNITDDITNVDIDYS